MSRPSDKEVLVVVGTGGMGLATARRIGAGRVILLADVNQSGLEAAAEGLSADGHQVVTQQVDVTSRESVAAVADTAASTGRVTAVVHTAGLSPQQASADAVLEAGPHALSSAAADPLQLAARPRLLVGAAVQRSGAARPARARRRWRLPILWFLLAAVLSAAVACGRRG